MSLTGFCVIGTEPPLDYSESERRERVTSYVWKHMPAGSTLLYVWCDPRAFVVLGSGIPPDAHSLRAVFGEDAETLPTLTLRDATSCWRSCVARLAFLAYGDEGALQARVRP